MFGFLFRVFGLGSNNDTRYAPARHTHICMSRSKLA